MRVWHLFCLLLSSCHAIVRFTDSILLDEYDLTVAEFGLDLCTANACKVYVSAPKSSFSSLDNIFIGATSLGDIARRKEKLSKLKHAYVTKNDPITNRNVDLACGPVAVYIVSERADFYDTALVYEPSSPSTTVRWKGTVPVTVLSYQPFRVASDVKSGALKVSVLTTGFDNVRENVNKCPSVADFRSTESFDFYFNGPVATFYSETEAEVELIVGSFQLLYRPLTTPSFITSFGYIGCANGDVYRSSLYPKSQTFHLFDKKKQNLNLNALLNTQDPVQLVADYHRNIDLRGSIDSGTWNQSLDLIAKSLDVTFTPTVERSSFLLKYSIVGPATSVASTSSIPSTTQSITSESWPTSESQAFSSSTNLTESGSTNEWTSSELSSVSTTETGDWSTSPQSETTSGFTTKTPDPTPEGTSSPISTSDDSTSDSSTIELVRSSEAARRAETTRAARTSVGSTISAKDAKTTRPSLSMTTTTVIPTKKVTPMKTTTSRLTTRTSIRPSESTSTITSQRTTSHLFEDRTTSTTTTVSFITSIILLCVAYLL